MSQESLTHSHFTLPDPGQFCVPWDKSQILSYLRVGHSTLDAMLAQGEFPQPEKLTARLSRWDSRVVIRWAEERLSGKAPALSYAEKKRVERMQVSLRNSRSLSVSNPQTN